MPRQQAAMEQIAQQAGAVTMVMLPQTAFEELRAEIMDLKGMMQAKAVEEANAMWIESEEARKMLGVSPRTWQSMRDRRELPFSQYGRKIYVRRADIEAFLEGHVISKDGGPSHE